MKAARLHSFGGSEALVVESVPDPEPAPGWVVVELRAAGLNWHDVLVRQGAYPAQLPLIPGGDGAGTRRDTGEPVIVFPSLWWGDSEAAPGDDWEILGDHHDGTYAELVAVPAENVFPRPAGWEWTEAAALGVAGATAYRALFSRGGLREGETALVLGAGSGVSTVAVSLARMAGARVLVTSSSEDKIARATELGAAGGVLYTDDDWPAHARELAGEAGIDLVLDSVGGTWPDALTTLNRGGRLVCFGATAGDTAQIAVRPFYFSQCSILGSTLASPRDFAGLLELIAAHPDWRPVIDTTMALDEVAAAHERMERRTHFGKLVLTVA